MYEPIQEPEPESQVELGTGEILHEAPIPESVEDPEQSRGELPDICKEKHGDEQDHCYQQLAVEEGNAKVCDRINSERNIGTEKEDWPKHKCISMVAVSLCELDICEELEEGSKFFTVTRCMDQVSEACGFQE